MPVTGECPRSLHAGRDEGSAGSQSNEVLNQVQYDDVWEQNYDVGGDYLYRPATRPTALPACVVLVQSFAVQSG
jgi:hypothetical protein